MSPPMMTASSGERPGRLQFIEVGELAILIGQWARRPLFAFPSRLHPNLSRPLTRIGSLPLYARANYTN